MNPAYFKRATGKRTSNETVKTPAIASAATSTSAWSQVAVPGRMNRAPGRGLASAPCGEIGLQFRAF